MKEIDKYRQGSLSEYRRYIRGEMTKGEENAFRRKFQNDPFAEDEDVSFSGVSQGEAIDDKTTLLKQPEKRIKSGKRMILLSTAALVAFLMVITSVFIILDRNKTAIQPFRDIVKLFSPDVTDQNQNAGLLPAGSKDIADTLEIEVKQGITNVKIDTAISAGTDSFAIAENTKTITMGTDSVLYIDKDQISAPAVESGIQERTDLNVRGEIISSENSQPGYINPQPVTGISNFNRYIEENMIKQPAQTQGDDSVVVVSFIVRTTGIIDSIKVINSPGDEFAREAVRLIMEGPAWKPAENNGQTMDDEVKVRIVF